MESSPSQKTYNLPMEISQFIDKSPTKETLDILQQTFQRYEEKEEPQRTQNENNSQGKPKIFSIQKEEHISQNVQRNQRFFDSTPNEQTKEETMFSCDVEEDNAQSSLNSVEDCENESMKNDQGNQNETPSLNKEQPSSIQDYSLTSPQTMETYSQPNSYAHFPMRNADYFNTHYVYNQSFINNGNQYIPYYQSSIFQWQILLSQTLSAQSFSPGFHFLMKLENDLNILLNNNESKLNKLKPIKENVLNLIKNFSLETLKEATKDKFDFAIYGSYATGLSIASSDIDILFTYENKEDLSFAFIDILTKAFINSGKLWKVDPIYTATYPVLKLEYSLNEYKEVMEETKEKTIKFDISFYNLFINPEVAPIKTVNYVNSVISTLPIIRPLVIFIKKYLQAKDLNSYYTGGFSSYAIFILVTAFIRVKYSMLQNLSYAHLSNALMWFLEFFCRLDFSKFCFDLNDDFPITMNNEEDPISILDPITNLNIGKGSCKFMDIQRSFTELIYNLRNKYEE
ncbi:MAG: nucleotidyltransferase domain-containing protein, partial [archaeon]|nr:nucleotidyltransferase domain-containing protein [archaeon]